MVEHATRLHWSGLWNMFDHGNSKDHETWFILVLRSWSNHGWPWYKVGHIPRGLWIMFDHGPRLTMVLRSWSNHGWPWYKVGHIPRGPWIMFYHGIFYDHGPRLTMVPRDHGQPWSPKWPYTATWNMVEHGLYMVISWSTMFLKHGRPCLKHGQPCFDRVHFTGVLLS